MKAKSTAVDVIFEKFNILSDADFKSWMLNSYDELKAMEKEQIEDAVIWFDDTNRRPSEIQIEAEQYYNETYGGDKWKKEQ